MGSYQVQYVLLGQTPTAPAATTAAAGAVAVTAASAAAAAAADAAHVVPLLQPEVPFHDHFRQAGRSMSYSPAGAQP